MSFWQISRAASNWDELAFMPAGNGNKTLPAVKTGSGKPAMPWARMQAEYATAPAALLPGEPGTADAPTVVVVVPEPI
jgi:hypothetical protein